MCGIGVYIGVGVIFARGGGGSSGGHVGGTRACGGSGDGSQSPSLIFHERSLMGGDHSFVTQMTARVCWGGGGVPFPLIRPKMGPKGKGPT